MEKWPAAEAQQQRRIAVHLLTEHDHNLSDRAVLTRENCGTCTLNGYHSSPRYGGDGRPNYAGWLRIFIQAGRPVRPHLAYKELTEAKDGADHGDYQATPNPHYYNAILRDIVTYGCPNRHGQYDARKYPHENVCPLCIAVKEGETPIPPPTPEEAERTARWAREAQALGEARAAWGGANFSVVRLFSDQVLHLKDERAQPSILSGVAARSLCGVDMKWAVGVNYGPYGLHNPTAPIDRLRETVARFTSATAEYTACPDCEHKAAELLQIAEVAR